MPADDDSDDAYAAADDLMAAVATTPLRPAPRHHPSRDGRSGQASREPRDEPRRETESGAQPGGAVSASNVSSGPVPILLESDDDDLAADEELDDIFSAVDDKQLRQLSHTRPPAPPPARLALPDPGASFRPPTAAAQATGGQVDLHGNVAALRRPGVLSVQNTTSPSHTARTRKQWDRSQRAATGPLRNRRAMPQPGEPGDDDEDVEDWDAARADHPLAGVGLFGPGVQGTASESTSHMPDASFVRYLDAANGTQQHCTPPSVDMHAAMTWIYPTNLPIRDYQYNIVQKALFKYGFPCTHVPEKIIEITQKTDS